MESGLLLYTYNREFIPILFQAHLLRGNDIFSIFNDNKKIITDTFNSNSSFKIKDISNLDKNKLFTITFEKGLIDKYNCADICTEKQLLNLKRNYRILTKKWATYF